MIRHQILITLRFLKRFRTAFLINLIGLTAGLVCALFIWLWVEDERKVDHFHKNNDRLYQVMEVSKVNNEINVQESTQGPLAAALQKDLPEVDKAIPVFSLEKEGLLFTVKTGDKVIRASGIFTGQDFFTAFSFPLLRGAAQQVLHDPNAIVLSEQLAASLFGTAANAMGKRVDWEMAGFKKQSTVSGVYAKPSAGNTMQFDVALSFDMLLKEMWTNGQYWWNEGPATYLLLKPGTDINRFNARIKDFTKTYHKDNLFSLFVRPYSSGYLHGTYDNGVQSGGRIIYVNLFTIIAVFILLIACINFMNLSTARAAKRLKEVGIKKAVGSTRGMLIMQFLGEAVFLALLALIIAIVVVMALLPAFNTFTGKQISLQPGASLILQLVVLVVATGLLAGSYPAFYLSRFNPVTILKGRPKNSLSEMFARKGLVVFQFTISLVLIVAVLVVYKQVDYIQSRNLGYDKSNIIYFDKEGAVMENGAAFLTGLRQLPGVVQASSIQQNVVQTGGNAATYGIDWPGKTKNDVINFVVRAVDYGLLETLGMQLKEGRSFSPGYGAEEDKLIFNETAIKAMGLTNPVGTKVRMWEKDCIIAGVVKDFHVSSLHEPIAPLVFRFDPARTATIMVKIAPGKEQQTISAIEAYHKQFNPGYVFDYAFLDSRYKSQYLAEQRVSVLSAYFAGLAILISCLGLFGLAAFNAEVRTKEIGIRKVLGASAARVIMLLSKEYLPLVLIAVVFAFPIAWWAMHNWLNGFAYKIAIGTEVFATAFAAIIIITIATVSYHALRAAFANPVHALRNE